MPALEADLAAIAKIDAVPSILKTIQEATGLRLTFVARVTEDRWIAAAVRDEMGFGLAVGGELDVRTTLCREVRDTRKEIVFEDAPNDPEFRDHPTPRMYKFASYASFPLFRKNGEYFGTLCGLDSRPLKLKDDKTISMMSLFSELISIQLEAEERHASDVAALEDAREVAELREQFIAVLGHDVRNPLSSIAIGTDLLAQQLDDPAALRVLDRIRRSAKRIHGLVDDVLDLARGRLGGGIEIETTPVDDIVQRIQHTTAEVQAANPTRKIDLDVVRAGTVHCDPKRIEQLVSNLLANAIQHGAEDSPVRVKVDGGEKDFTIAVENEGPPIPAGARARLFQPYFRGEQQSQRTEGGLGLGLYIVSEIAKSHHGTIDITSADGRTTFTFSMPSS